MNGPALPFGEYRLRRALGGGMHDVWLARHQPSASWRVIKRLPPPVLATERDERVRRFEREVRALRAARHPALPELLDHGRVADTPFVAVTWIDGRDLADDLSGGSLPADAAGFLALAGRFTRLAAALHALHLAGFVHRDVQPANVRIDRSGALWLLDLGLVGPLESERITVTRTGSLVGTPATLAPEQIDPRRGTVGPRTDVYGLGATLYWAATGRPPVGSAAPARLLDRILAGDVADPAGLVPGMPARLRGVLARALAVDPRDRYPTAAAFGADLARVARGQPPEPWRQRRRAVARRLLARARAPARWGATVALGVVLAALVVPIVLDPVDAGSRIDPVAVLRRLEVACEVGEVVAGVRPERRATLDLARQGLQRSRSMARELLDATPSVGDPGRQELLARITARLATAEELGARLGQRAARIDDWLERARGIDAAAWAAAARSIADDPRFAGFALRPRPGLVPIGAGPGCLQHFHDLASAAPGVATPRFEGDAPGRLAIAAGHGIVFVLLPPRAAGSAPLWFAAHELTRAQWRRLTGEREPNRYGPGQITAGGEGLRGPVMDMSCAAARAFAVRHGYDLPSTDEWWFAATAGGAEARPTAADPRPDSANLRDLATLRTWGGSAWSPVYDGFAFDAVVGALAPNGFGIHDCFGNVEEPVRGYVPGDEGPLAVALGGSWRWPNQIDIRWSGQPWEPHAAGASVGIRVVLRF